MGDPRVDWKIIELPKTETEETEEGSGRVALILHRGWTLGKKIAIAGVAVSSAPIVLPPLMLFSALGFAFSVPFGLVFASYACTDKLIRSLLPVQIPLLEEEVDYENKTLEEESDRGFAAEDNEIGGDAEKDDVEVEERGENARGSCEDEKQKGDDVGEMEIVKREEEDGVVGEEKEKEDDDVGDMEREKQVLEKEEIGRERRRKEDNVDETEEDRLVVEQGENVREFTKNDKEKEGDVGEIRENKEAVEREGDVGEITDGMVAGEAEKSNGIGNIGVGVEVVEGIEDAGDSSEHDQTVASEREKAHDVGEIGEGKKIVGREENVRDINEDEESRLRMGETVDTTEDKNVVPQQSTPTIDKVDGNQKPITVVDSEHDSAVPVAPIVQKVDSETSCLSSETVVHALDGSEAKKEDSVEHPDLSSKPAAIATSEMETVKPTSEALYTAEEIWEQIKAIRMIVGYKAALHASYTRELKALYLFTGVDLPPSFKDSSDLIEVNDKLRFLKSVVGIK